jgi:hypothetical protein
MWRNFHDDEDIATDEEDEFFDAIEANAPPNLVVSHLLTSLMPGEPALSFMSAEPGTSAQRFPDSSIIVRVLA